MQWEIPSRNVFDVQTRLQSWARTHDPGNKMHSLMNRFLTFTAFVLVMAASSMSPADHDGDLGDVVFEEIERILIEEYFGGENG